MLPHPGCARRHMGSCFPPSLIWLCLWVTSVRSGQAGPLATLGHAQSLRLHLWPLWAAAAGVKCTQPSGHMFPATEHAQKAKPDLCTATVYVALTLCLQLVNIAFVLYQVY